jgi:hypothetical protein
MQYCATWPTLRGGTLRGLLLWMHYVEWKVVGASAQVLCADSLSGMKAVAVCVHVVVPGMLKACIFLTSVIPACVCGCIPFSRGSVARAAHASRQVVGLFCLWLRLTAGHTVSPWRFLSPFPHLSDCGY